MPLFPAAPLLLGHPRYHPAPAVVDACVGLVQGEGGARFFRAPDALSRLRAIYEAAVRAHGPGRVAEPGEALAAMQEDLARDDRGRARRQALQAALL